MNKKECKFDQTSCYKNNCNDSDIGFNIIEALKSKFGFKSASVSSPNLEGIRTIDVSYDDRNWMVLRLHVDTSISETIGLIRSSLSNNNWDDTYKLSPYSILLDKIIDEFNMNIMGYYQIRNDLYRVSDNADSLDEVTGTTRLENIILKFNRYDDIESISLTTNEGEFLLTEGECKFMLN